ncbi:protein amnionless isoform X3 [Bacillus rossius redtenbacheri]|uniref:protein amnionless isoform X3 n=1 Tax=Bacillus rossius redtenbacheri TaxID=93214 RepID=UPI002FDC8136
MRSPADSARRASSLPPAAMDLTRISSLLAAVTLAAATGTKTWLPDTNYGNPANWDARRVPCSADRAVFPRGASFSVLLPGGSTGVRALVLPPSGELMLPPDCELAVTGRARPRADCPDPKDVVFSRRGAAPWLLPGNWRSDAPGDWPATPHAHRVPCQEDAVVFPGGRSFGVELPREPVYVRRLSLQGQDVSSAEWSEFLMSDAGEWQFAAPEESRQFAVTVTGGSAEEVAACGESSGCRCVSEAAEAEVCRLQAPLCGPPPPCWPAVRPLGHCCDVCGTYVLLDYTDRFRLTALKAAVEEVLKEEGFSGLAKHVGKAAETGQVQVVLVDRGGYSSAPGDAARRLTETLSNRRDALGLTRMEIHSSGPAVSPGGPARIVGGVFGTLFAVVAVLGLLYLVFVVFDGKPLLSLTAGGGYSVFARFDNSAEEEAGRHDETALEAAAALEVALRRPQKPPHAFDNPMFGQRPPQGKSAMPPVGREPTQENPVFLEMQGRRSSTSEDTAEEELLSSQDEDAEDEGSPSAPAQ